MRRNTKELRRRRRRGRRIRRTLILLSVLLLLAAAAFAGWTAHQSALEKAERQNYPIRYSEQISAAAAEFDLEEAFIYAIVLAESSFRTEAVSNVGALGLMQIMPETGHWIARKFDMGDAFTADMLTDPAVNTRFGSWYLRFLLDRYDGNMRCAAAAYHAGQGTVDKWLKDPAISADGLTLTDIPSDATNNYVNKVMKNYEKYRSLLAKDD